MSRRPQAVSSQALLSDGKKLGLTLLLCGVLSFGVFWFGTIYLPYQRDAILEITTRAHVAEVHKNRGTIFLSVDTHDPPESLLRRFKNDRFQIRKISTAKPYGHKWGSNLYLDETDGSSTAPIATGLGQPNQSRGQVRRHFSKWGVHNLEEIVELGARRNSWGRC